MPSRDLRRAGRRSLSLSLSRSGSLSLALSLSPSLSLSLSPSLSHSPTPTPPPPRPPPPPSPSPSGNAHSLRRAGRRSARPRPLQRAFDPLHVRSASMVDSMRARSESQGMGAATESNDAHSPRTLSTQAVTAGMRRAAVPACPFAIAKGHSRPRESEDAREPRGSAREPRGSARPPALRSPARSVREP